MTLLTQVNPVSPNVINVGLAISAICIPVLLAFVAWIGRSLAKRSEEISKQIKALGKDITTANTRLNETTTKVDNLTGALNMHSRTHNGNSP